MEVCFEQNIPNKRWHSQMSRNFLFSFFLHFIHLKNLAYPFFFFNPFFFDKGGMLLALRNFFPGYLLLNRNISRCRPYFLCRGLPDSCCFVRTPCRNSFCTVYLTAPQKKGGWIRSTTLHWKFFTSIPSSFSLLFFFFLLMKWIGDTQQSTQCSQIKSSDQ